MSESAVVFEQVVKKFSGKRALDEVSLALPKGKVIGIVGENGSGKSTSLKLMAGLLQPSSGQVLVGGQQSSRLSSRHVAYLPEQDAYYPFYTVGETVRFYSEVYEDFDLEKAFDMCGTFGLELGAKIAVLSKGNRGRLKIVLALSRRAPLILMDEPLSGLDPIVRESIIRSMISYLEMPQQTLILTTHEVAEIESMLDIAIVMRDGKSAGCEEVDTIREIHGVGLVGWMKQMLV